MSKTDHIILFDGVCNLCNGAVQFVLKRDKEAIFKFASLQSDAGKKLLETHGLPEDHLKSFVYICNDSAYTKSDAALKVAAQLSYPTKFLSWSIVVPKFIRDFVYDLIARNRYRMFGKKETCMLPAPALMERFLN